MRAAALTDTGLVRESNQDTVFSSTAPVGALPNLFIVADGMGGHQAGDYCSRMLVDRLVAALQSGEETVPLRALRQAIGETNLSLFREAEEREELSGMGSTLVAAFTEEETACVFNIGDSRLYAVEESGALRQVTRDHSYVEEMVSAGKLERGSEQYYQNKNIITRAVGIAESADADVFELPLTGCSALLLCTDGLTNMVTDAEIAELLRKHQEPEDAVHALIHAANTAGGRDNISAVLVQLAGEEARR